jgi:tetrahydromethanopterin S-methyltransferase subunit B
MEELVKKLQEEVAALEKKVNDMITRLAVAETNIKEIYKTLDKINSNTTWILRIIIGTIVGGLLALLIKGGI